MMGVMSDYAFYTEHGSDLATVAGFMISFVQFANTIFRQTDFNGVTGIGLAVQKVCARRTILFYYPMSYRLSSAHHRRRRIVCTRPLHGMFSSCCKH